MRARVLVVLWLPLAACTGGNSPHADSSVEHAALPDHKQSLPYDGQSPHELGALSAGLGGLCSATKSCPDPTMTCVTLGDTSGTGFCTIECPLADLGKASCGGAGFFCALGDSAVSPTRAFCLFVCTANELSAHPVTFSCPAGLSCTGEPDSYPIAIGSAAGICEP